MNAVTFCGHHDTPTTIASAVRQAIVDCITAKDTTFLVGCEGVFDAIVYKTLCTLRNEGIPIRFFVILAYHPTLHPPPDWILPTDTIYPFTRSIHPRFAIAERNRYLLKTATTLICYVKHFVGGAATMYRAACTQKKKIINLADA